MDLQEDWIGVAVAHGAQGDRKLLSMTLCFKKDDDTV
jgi:hypothetical protein